MKKLVWSKLGREILFGAGAIVFVILLTILSVKKIHQREDLALLQIDFTDVIIKSKKCFDNGGVVQDPSKGEDGQVFICSNQEIVEDTFPVLKELSRRGFEYRYLSSKKCLPSRQTGQFLDKGCDGDDKNNDDVKRINIGRGNKLVLSCNVIEGICRGR